MNTNSLLKILLSITPIITNAQSYDSTSTNIMNYDLLIKPQMKRDWNNPGVYELVANLTRSRISKGDSTILSVYITGYGLSGNCKLFFLPSQAIFDTTSKLHNSFTLIKEERGNNGITQYAAKFGGDIVSMPQTNKISILIHGIKIEGWEYSTIFMDESNDSSDFRILSEERVINPPFKFDLYSRKNIESGDYNINLFLTYFNGKEWKQSKQILPIHINSWFEDHSGYPFWAAVIGIPIAIIALIFQAVELFLSIKMRRKEQASKNQKPHDQIRDNDERLSLPNSPKHKKTYEQLEKAKAQRREFVRKWRWKIKSIILLSAKA